VRVTRTIVGGLILGLVLVPGRAQAEGAARDETLPPSAEDVRPVLVGTPVPDGPLKDGEGRATTLAELRGGSPTVLVFYRGHW
jgi:hypothetical protein